jgi:hypothetical protein
VPNENAGGFVVIETLLLLSVVAGVGGLLVQVYRWRQDVLYGPYIRREWRLIVHERNLRENTARRARGVMDVSA